MIWSVNFVTNSENVLMKHPEQNYEIIIKPNKSWFYVDWQGLLHYRDLLFLLVRRDFVARYKQTILGPIWFIVQPLFTAFTFTIVFANVIKVSTDQLPPMLFYMCALVPWGYFASSLETTSKSLLANAALFNKVYFPRLIIPLSIIISNLIALTIQLSVFLVFYFYFKFLSPLGVLIQPNLFILVLPLFLLQTAAVALGFGLWVSAMTVKYRDFQNLMTFLIPLWMYATPIIYPTSVVSEKWRVFLALNPMAGIVDSFRYAFFGSGYINELHILISVVGTIVVLVSGILVFNKVERTFVDWI